MNSTKTLVAIALVLALTAAATVLAGDVGNTASDTVTEIDAQKKVLATIPVGRAPKAKVALFHDAYLAFAASHDFWSFAMNRWNAASPRSGRSNGSF